MGDQDGSVQVEFSFVDFRYMNWRMDIRDLMQGHYSGAIDIEEEAEEAEGEEK